MAASMSSRLERRTKIVATLGPASLPRLEEMILAGVNVFRINFSHIADPYEQEPVVKLIRATSASLGIPVSILGDLCGPKIRTSPFAGEGYIDVADGQRIKLAYHPTDHGDSERIVTAIEPVCRQLEAGQRVLFDDGNLRAQVVEKISDHELVLEMKNSWRLKSKKGINVPDIKLDVSCVTDKDLRDLEFCWKWRVDFVAMSFVQRRSDVEDLRKAMEKLRAVEMADSDHYDYHSGDSLTLEISPGLLRINLETWRPMIISKIETPGGMEDIDHILEASDGVMVARGDLGVELSLESVPISQKLLIDKAHQAAKPVIVATQMLESMIHAPVPTRAEVSDVANAVFDGADAIMLSGEAAVGAYPVAAVQVMATVCIAAEKEVRYHRQGMQVDAVPSSGWGHTAEPIVPEDFRFAIANGAVSIGAQAKAEAILTLTTTGDMAALISKSRPNLPIIAATGSPAAVFRMALLYGVTPIFCRTLAAVHDTSPEDKLQTLDRGLERTHSTTSFASLGADHHQHKHRKDKAIIVTASGYVHGLPGLSEICRLSRFGDATRALRARTHWQDAFSTVLARRGTPPIPSRTPPIASQTPPILAPSAHVPVVGRSSEA
ncbi:Pyruvate/Phosphoenolpyruvate kinase-like domain-containing protein [Hyaloraphidium curvatum]|nr:Pyruvate/Phosphoenolpyruvate kinase-like domain-containing protein [Hyaloraphidium curvatum]